MSLLDAFAEPDRTAAQWAARRDLLLGQLAYLLDEVAALGPLLARLPVGVLEGAPTPDARSVKQVLGYLATRDRHFHAPRVAALAGAHPPAARAALPEDTALPEEVAEDAAAWNATALDTLLEALRVARTDLHAAFAALPDWHHTAQIGEDAVDGYTLALQIVQHDATVLRDVAYQLHAARLTDRPQDLPK